MYDPALQGTFNTPQEIQRPTIIFDDEVKEILQKTYNEMINGMINLAIKRFAETKEFKDYFARKEYREIIQPKENIEEPQVTNENVVAQVSQPSQAPQQNSAISAISAW